MKDWRLIDISGRNYSDFLGIVVDMKNASVQVDCAIEKARGCEQVLILLFPKCELQLMLPLKRRTISCVICVLDFIKSIVGFERFKWLLVKSPQIMASSF